MSDVLRAQWLVGAMCKALSDYPKLHERESSGPDQVWRISQSSGELSIEGVEKKPLQVTHFLSVKVPVTAALSDKFHLVNCEFSAKCESEFEAKNSQPLASIEGALICPTSYEILFRGMDGALFGKGGSLQDQSAGGNSISRNSGGGSGAGPRSGGKHRATAYRNNWEDVPLPEPILFIREFEVLGSQGSDVWGDPRPVIVDHQLKELLLGLPRNNKLKEVALSQPGHGKSERVSSGPGRARRSGEGGYASTARKSHQGQYWPGGTTVRGAASRGGGKANAAEPNVEDETLDLLSQPEWSTGSGDDDDDNSQPFATQAANRPSTTFDEFTFATQSHKKNKTPYSLSQSSLAPSLRSMHKPKPCDLPNSKETDSRGHPTGPSLQTENKPQPKSKYINYSGDASHDHSLNCLAVSYGGPMSKTGTKRRTKRNPEPLGVPLHLEFQSKAASLPAKTSGRDLAPSHPGWGGMAEVTRQVSTVPKDQKERLEQPNSWYPQEGTFSPYFSGYENTPKAQLVPKAHQPRVPQSPAIRDAARKAVDDSSQKFLTVDSSDSEIPWSSSPEHGGRQPRKNNISGTPPHSSMISSVTKTQSPRTPAAKGTPRGASVNAQVVGGGNSPVSSQDPGSRKKVSVGGAGNRNNTSHSRQSLGTKDLTSGNTWARRITRSANGISKKVAPDPTNSEFKRLNQSPQRIEDESEDADESDSFPGSCSREFSVEPPFPIHDPNGLTLAAKYGILGSQQVDIWNKNRRMAQKSEGDIVVIDESDDGFDDDFDGGLLASSHPDQSGGSKKDSKVKTSGAALEHTVLGAPRAHGRNASQRPHHNLEKDHKMPNRVPYQDLTIGSPSSGRRSPSGAVSPTMEPDPDEPIPRPDSRSSSEHKKPASGSDYPDKRHEIREMQPEFDKEAMDISDNNKAVEISDDDIPQEAFPPSKPPSKRSPYIPKRGNEVPLKEEVLPARVDRAQNNRHKDMKMTPRASNVYAEDPRLAFSKVGLPFSSQGPDNNTPRKKGNWGRKGVSATDILRPATTSPHQPPHSPKKPAAAVQVKETPYHNSNIAITLQMRQPCLDSNSDQEVIPGTTEMPDSSQEQLLREQHEHLRVQVSAPSKKIQSLGKGTKSKTKPRVMKQVESTSEETKAAGSPEIPKLLEKQKRQFLGLADETPLEVGPARKISLISEDDEEYETWASPSPGPRKRHKISHVPEPQEQPTGIPTHSAPPDPAPGRTNPTTTIDLGVSTDEESNPEPSSDPRLENPLWFADESAKPEVYAGIRERTIYVPGYKDMTEKQRVDLNHKRKVYFGVGQARPWNHPWKSVAELAELERIRSANQEHPSPPPKVGDEWYRNENTPIKQFLRSFKELKTVKADVGRTGAKDGGNEVASKQ